MNHFPFMRYVETAYAMQIESAGTEQIDENLHNAFALLAPVLSDWIMPIDGFHEAEIQ